MRKLVSIVAPMYNEEKLVDQYCEETLGVMESIKDKYDYEVILVNDGSRDQTYQLMKRQQEKSENITIVNLTRNFGLEGAVNAGIECAKGDAVVVMDADLQDPPALIVDMIAKWEEGADVVVASRVARSNDNFLKKFTANVYYKILNKFAGKMKLEKSAANFRLLSRKALNTILEMPEVNRVFRVVVPYVGMNTAVIEYDRDKRFAGKTKYNLKSMIPYALDSITGISVAPLRLIFWLMPLFFILFLVTLIVGVLTEGDVRLFMWIVSFVSLVMFIMSIALSIMAEYLAQIMTEVKGRPTSLVYDYEPAKVVKEREE